MDRHAEAGIVTCGYIGYFAVLMAISNSISELLIMGFIGLIGSVSIVAFLIYSYIMLKCKEDIN